MTHNLFVLLPEIVLAILGFFVQLLGISRFSNTTFCRVALIGVGLVIYILFRYHLGLSLVAFDGSYVQNDYTIFCKFLILFFTFLIIMNYIGYNKSIFRECSAEYIVLILFTAIGASIAISARDFLILFLGFELQSLACYVMAAFNKNDILSSEAGMKYFVLGALSSCFMLFGISFIYGFTGTISYSAINNIIMINNYNIALITAVVFLFAGLFFKMSIVPFHAWTPDVYEGSPIISLNFFASVQKISILVVFVTLCSVCIKPVSSLFHDFIAIVAILSIITGSIGGIMQKSVKRMMAYSTILNMGYCIIPLVLWAEVSAEVSLKYLIIYISSTIAFFAILTSSLGASAESVQIDDLMGLGRTKKAAALSITLIMFSMIGIPPIAGFFGKYYILYHAFNSEEYILVFSLLIGSLISAYYYLSIIKAMYFCDNLSEESTSKLNIYLLIVIIISLGFTLFYSIIPSIPSYYFLVLS